MNRTSIGGLGFIGCMFLGGGIGMAYDELVIGGAIGMGIGFLGMAMVYTGGKKERLEKAVAS